MSRFQTDTVVTRKRKADERNMTVLYIEDAYSSRYGQCCLSCAGPNSDVTVTDAETGKLKRIESPNGEVIKICLS